MAETQYWRCRACAIALPHGESLPLYPCPWCGSGKGFDLVAVLPVAEVKRLRGIEARLRDDDLAYSFAKEGHTYEYMEYRQAVLWEGK